MDLVRPSRLFSTVVVSIGIAASAQGGVSFHWDDPIQEALRIVPVPAQHQNKPVPVLIKGAPVSPGSWKQTVRITTGGSGCTATIVGPRVLATASHCAANGATSVFKLDGIEYRAKITRHPLYPGKDMDVSLGLIDQEIKGIEFGTLPNKVDVVKKGMAIRLMGYGCINPGGGGGNDGILREGMSEVTGFSGFDIVTQKSGGSALCFGDSGGPAWIEVEGTGQLIRYNISQNSKGDIQKTSYLARWDVKEAQDFVRKWIADNGNQTVCGINKDCVGGTNPDPDPDKPKTFSIDGTTVTIQGTIKDKDLLKNPNFVKRAMEQAVMFLDSQ